MSIRAVAFIRKAAKKILSDNREQVARKRLHGPLFYRERACKIATDILALTRMNSGIEWTSDQRDKRRDEITGELRKISVDIRTGADGRIAAIQRLAILDGILPETELGDSPQDAYIRTLLKPSAPETPEPKPAPVDFAAILKAVDDKLAADAAR